jgi:hypothetical protein
VLSEGLIFEKSFPFSTVGEKLKLDRRIRSFMRENYCGADRNCSGKETHYNSQATARQIYGSINLQSKKL